MSKRQLKQENARLKMELDACGRAYMKMVAHAENLTRAIDAAAGQLHKP